VKQKGTVRTTIQDDGGTGVGWESTDASGTQGNRNGENTKINILGNLTVPPHEASVDVPAIGKGRLAADQAPEASDNLTTVVKDRVGDSGSVKGKEHAVDEDVASGKVSRRVSLVTRLVERGVLVDDLQHLIAATGVIPDVIVVDRDVTRVPGVGVPDCEDYWSREERTEEAVEYAVKGVDQGVSRNSELIPVPGGNGVEAKTTDTASDCSQVDIVRGEPRHPVEVGQRLDDVVREPEVDEHRKKAVHEPPHSGDGPAVYDLVGLGVEGTLWQF
jgi:hypothetical protein